MYTYIKNIFLDILEFTGKSKLLMETLLSIIFNSEIFE